MPKVAQSSLNLILSILTAHCRQMWRGDVFPRMTHCISCTVLSPVVALWVFTFRIASFYKSDFSINSGLHAPCKYFSDYLIFSFITSYVHITSTNNIKSTGCVDTPF